MSNKKHFKYACLYTDGGMRTLNNTPGAGAGIHGYFFDSIDSMRYAGVGHLITVQGYQPKPTGPQLKDTKYNPTFTNWELTQAFRADGETACKVEKDSEILLVDGWRGIINQPTNNRGEMQALIDIFTTCPVTADHYLLQADSMLVINGYNKDMEIWKTRNWITTGGSEVKNQDLWKKIDEIKTKHGDKIELKYIKAHAGFYGNESADRNATHGVCSAVNGDAEIHWKLTTLTDSDYWNPDKPIPPVLRSKWCYGLTGSERKTVEIDGDNYYQYFCGDHSKNADDAELLGKEISDAGFSLVYNRKKIEIIDNVQKYHVINMWDNASNSYRSDVINMVNINNINTPKELWRLNNVNLEALIFKSHRNDLISSDERLLSQMIRPPKLSYRALEIELELDTVLYSILTKLGHKVSNPSKLIALQHMVLNDVTDLFYKKSIGKNNKVGANTLTDFYDTVAKSVKLKVKHPCGDDEVDLILSRGIDLPSRNIMSAMAGESPKVYVATWRFSSRSFKYAFYIETTESFSLWEGYYSGRRDLE